LTLPPRDPRVELNSRLENAPAEHAEALLAGYEVLQGLHDRGVLELLRGALGSSDEVLEIAVNAARSPHSIRGIRNLLLLANMLGEIDPETLGNVTQAIPQALKPSDTESEPPGIWKLMRSALGNGDVRRGLQTAISLLEALGKSSSPKTGKST
jgi:uncharacterized protein YjgD (DUF1641 family)